MDQGFEDLGVCIAWRLADRGQIVLHVFNLALRSRMRLLTQIHLLAPAREFLIASYSRGILSLAPKGRKIDRAKRESRTSPAHHGNN
jgi:hypothetical protein